MYRIYIKVIPGPASACIWALIPNWSFTHRQDAEKKAQIFRDAGLIVEVK